MVTQENAAMSISEAAESIQGGNMDGLLGISDDTPEEQETHEEVEEVSAETSEETEHESKPEGEEEAGAKSEEEEAEASQNEEEAQIETFADLAKALEQSPEELEANLKTTIKINGESSDVTLAELKSGYQREQDYTRKTMELAEQRKTAEEQFTNQYTQVQQSHQIAGAVLGEVAKLFAGEEQRIQELIATDPVEGFKAKAAYDSKIKQLHQINQSAAQHFQQFQQQNQVKTESEKTALKQTEIQKLQAAIPDWSDEKVSAMADYFGELGLSKDYLDNQLDHRFYVMADKAMQFDKISSKAEVAKKQVKTLPKLQSNAKKQTPKTTKFESAAKRLKKSGSIEDAMRAVTNSKSLNAQLGL